MRRFSRTQWSRIGAVWFVTLTYHESWRHAEQRPQEQLNAFLAALRRSWPGLHYVWRMEAQRRGAPHFHLMLMFERGRAIPDSAAIGARCETVWHRLVEPDSEAHARHGTDVREASSWRTAWAYLSKYVAKSDGAAAHELPGRQWGTSRRIPSRACWHAPLDEGDWRRLRAVLRGILKARPHTTARTLEWFDGAGTMHLYVTADELRAAAPELWAEIRAAGCRHRAAAARGPCRFRASRPPLAGRLASLRPALALRPPGAVCQ